MEEGNSTKILIGQPLSAHNERPATIQDEQPTQSSSSQRSATEYQAMDTPLLPQAPIGENPTGERAQCSARGEPAINISQPIQDSTLATCQHIVAILGQLTDQQDSIMRELRTMHREMRLMKGEQRRTSSRVVSVSHDLEALKDHLRWE